MWWAAVGTIPRWNSRCPTERNHCRNGTPSRAAMKRWCKATNRCWRDTLSKQSGFNMRRIVGALCVVCTGAVPSGRHAISPSVRERNAYLGAELGEELLQKLGALLGD